jgi:hypothetical protein
MHGKQFLLDSVYAGINSEFVYGRLDFAGPVPDKEFDLVVNLESWASEEARPRRSLRLDAKVQDGKLTGFTVSGREDSSPATAAKGDDGAKVALARSFEFRLPLSWLMAAPASAPNLDVAQTAIAGSKSAAAGKPKPTAVAIAPTSRLRLRFSLWQNRLPADAMPMEGWIELQLLSEAELESGM